MFIKMRVPKNKSFSALTTPSGLLQHGLIMLDNEEIAITGYSGRYANCSNTEDFRRGLYEGRDFITENHARWPHESFNISPRLGIVPDLDRFDANFFGMNPKETNNQDPRLKKLLEVVFEAIVDAGMSPSEMRGTNTGVFMAISQNSALHMQMGFVGRSAAVMVNLLSFAFNFTGPSYSLDAACGSSLYAVSQAADAIRLGRCDSAIVCGTQVHLDPSESIEFLRNGVVGYEGKCRTYDKDRSGYVKADGIVAVLLQRKKDSRRIYSTIAAYGSNVDGFKEDGQTHPSWQMHKKLYEKVYEDFNVNPLEVSYFETHGTGTRVGDLVECKAVTDFFCVNRKEPLLIGSVKSNVGHSENASGLVSITKLLTSIQSGVIPGNLHFKTPDPEIEGLVRNLLHVVDKNTPLPSGLLGVNSFGFGGANATACLRPFPLKRQIPNEEPYRLVKVSGRTQEGVEDMLKSIAEHKDNSEYLTLLDNAFHLPIMNHNYRGFGILTNDSESTTIEVDKYSSKQRPVWFVYAGMGSQWPAMARDLMRIDVFRDTMLKCAEALKPYGLDLVDIVTNGSKETFEDILNCFPAIVATSVALTDVLSALGIRPDGIIGHSLGEACCAYADGAITAEQATLAGYARGLVSKTVQVQPGMMAAVGLSAKDCQEILPSDIIVACDNADESVTISGPATSVETFLLKLKSDGIFHRQVDTAGRAFHSKLLAPTAPKLLELLKTFIPDRKPRSKKWLPSSVLESDWESTDLGRFNSAEYHLHNFLNPVYFRQCLARIPDDSIVVEIAPRGLLQAILKRSLDKRGVTNLALVNKDSVDNQKFFYQSIGKFYNAGGSVDLRRYYKQAPFPVSVDTPSLSHLIKWDHKVKWDIPTYNPGDSFGRKFDLDLNEQENKFLESHVINGRNILPASSYMFFAWKAFADMLGQPQFKLPVVFENVKTPRPVLLSKNEITHLKVNIFKSSGHFQITSSSESSPICMGRIYAASNTADHFQSPEIYSTLEKSGPYKLKMNSDDLYKELHLRGYDYDEPFNGILTRDLDGRSSTIKWTNQWISFLDCVTQHVVSTQPKGHFLPLKYTKVVIDPELHLQMIRNDQIELDYNKFVNCARCGGVEIVNLQVAGLKRRYGDAEPNLDAYEFIPNCSTKQFADPKTLSLTVATQIALENTMEHLYLNVGTSGDGAIEIVKRALPKYCLKRCTFKKIDLNSPKDSFDLIVTDDITKESDQTIINLTKVTKFLFATISRYDDDIFPAKMFDLEPIYKHSTPNKTYILFKRVARVPEDYCVIYANNNNFQWVEDVKSAIRKYKDNSLARVYLVNSDYNSGVVGFFNCLKMEMVCPNLRVFLIRNGPEVEKFSIRSTFFSTQLQKDLTVNVYDKGAWGTLRLIPLKPLSMVMTEEACLLNIGSGRNAGIRWTQQPFENKKDLISVHYATINSPDVPLMLGKAGLPDLDSPIGLEYSGLDHSGNKTMGLVPRGALSTFVQPHPILTWKVQNTTWTLEEASTIPLAYATTYYSLCLRANLSPTDRVLILNGSHCTSAAAIGLMLSPCGVAASNVYVVVNTEGEKSHLKQRHPHLQSSNILMKQSFQSVLMKLTKGGGVNVVFNPQSEEDIKGSSICASKYARIVQIDSDSIDDLFVCDDLANRRCLIVGVKSMELFDESEEVLNKISTGIERILSNILPLKSRVFGKNDIESVLRHIQGEPLSEKCVVKIKTQGGFFSRPDNSILSQPRSYMNPEKVYIIVGGLGGFGLELTKWLISRGATKIILNSRRDVYSGYQAYCLQKWNKDEGVAVLTDISDTTTLEGAESLLKYALNLGPVGGIYNIALSLKDEAILDQTPETFETCVAPKLFSAQNFDFLSRKHCPRLDHFVMFSSGVSSLGNVSQSNYGFANSALERLCESRRNEGLHALAVEWGPVGDVGYVARLKTKAKFLESVPQSILSCLDVFEDFLLQDDVAVVSSYEFSDKDDEGRDGRNKKSLLEAVASLFGFKNLSSIDEGQSLLNLGMDSLLAFEVKHLLKEYDIEMSVADVRSTSFEKLRGLGGAKEVAT